MTLLPLLTPGRARKKKKKGDDPGACASPAEEAEVLDITILRTPPPPRPGPPPSDPSPLRGGDAEGMEGGREGREGGRRRQDVREEEMLEMRNGENVEGREWLEFLQVWLPTRSKEEI